MLTASDIPYPASTAATGVVTLAVNLDGTGQIMNIQTLRDIPTLTTQATITLAELELQAGEREWKAGAVNSSRQHCVRSSLSGFQ